MNPFVMGQRGYRFGVDRKTGNPFPSDTAQWAAWDHGWLDAFYEATDD